MNLYKVIFKFEGYIEANTVREAVEIAKDVVVPQCTLLKEDLPNIGENN
jgi:hypothetical protein